jgi:hypothetical protein
MAALRMVVPLVVLMSAMASAQSQVVTITEPGVYKISELFKSADVVALVKIVSGNSEDYQHTVYKGEVIQSFKGMPRGATVYFGPFVGERLGWEYVLFLRNVTKPITPKATATASYGTVPYSEVFNEGYSSMETSYACVFDGKEIAQQCDYGVRVCTDYIKLPKSMPAFPRRQQSSVRLPLGQKAFVSCWIRWRTARVGPHFQLARIPLRSKPSTR